MKTIHKFRLTLSREQIIMMPQDAKVLCVQEQAGSICIWAEVFTNEPLVEHHFWVVGTGQEITPDMDAMPYIGTVQDDRLVWHVYGGIEL